MYAVVSNAGNGRRARRERGTVVRASKLHMCFVSLIMLRPPSLTEQEAGGGSFSSSKVKSKEVCDGWRGFLFGPLIQNKASCSLGLVLFVCISSYRLGSPCMEGREKDSSLTAFDVHVLWSHVKPIVC